MPKEYVWNVKKFGKRIEGQKKIIRFGDPIPVGSVPARAARTPDRDREGDRENRQGEKARPDARPARRSPRPQKGEKGQERR